MDFNHPSTLRVNCARGLADYLESEVVRLGYDVESKEETGVELIGTLNDAMRLNLALRTGLYVLYRLDRLTCTTPDELYHQTVDWAWDDIVDSAGYLSIASTVDTPTITDSRFANLRLKDAIVDRISQQTGHRPDSGPARTGVVVNLYWQGSECLVYLNTTGRKLADRGYRKIPHKAPMQEALAAGVVLATGYDGTQPLVNPMCGAGTLAIEAALIATGRAPGLLRDQYGIQHIKGFDAHVWQSLRNEIRKDKATRPIAPIIASDHDPTAIEAARQNAKTAGVDQLIQFETCDFAETTLPEPPGVVIMNPEYGERLGETRALEDTYARIGDFLKQRCAGYTGYIFSGNLPLAKKIGLRTSRRQTFFNARIECRLLRYEMYEGSRRG